MPRDDSSTDLRRSSETPLYASLARVLTDEITNGRLPVGSLLPTEEALAQTYAVSRQTVREALRVLDGQGLVSRRRGIGTRVLGAAPQRRYTIEVESINDIVEYLKQARLEVSSMVPVLADARLAELLGCREGSRWLEVEGMRFHADSPRQAVAVVKFHLRDGYAGIEQALREIGGTAVHQMLEQRYAEQIDEIRQHVTAVAIVPADAVRLCVPAHSPGLKIDRRFTGRGGRVVFASQVIYPGERFSYAGSFRRDRGN